MIARRYAQWLAFWLCVVSGIILLITLLAVPLFALFVKMANLGDVAMMSGAKLMHNFYQLMGYLYNPFVHTLHMSNFPTSPHGAVHFADVKHLFMFNLVVFIVTVGPTWRWLRNLRRYRQRHVLVIPAVLGIVVPVVLGGLMAINFDAFFVKFHELLFRNSDWMFDPVADPIINALPEEYFGTCFVLGFGLLVVLMVVCIVGGLRDKKVRAAKQQ